MPKMKKKESFSTQGSPLSKEPHQLIMTNEDITTVIAEAEGE
jgi:hypothetical protein